MAELTNKKMKFVRLPPHSPELNPIENFFAVLKGKLVNHPEIPHLTDHITHVIEYDIEQEYVNSLTDSMP